ncbi:MAG TPA: PorP/SprF family type IX secretion system membrane protein [Saprospiraceae bacterium]|nr:PorP/SprF family type IX secretion system membrane protein [Saprospiraceae bacterium]
MNKTYLLFIFGILFLLPSLKLVAQQERQYSMTMLNPYSYNAAFAGQDYSLSATGVFRRQWLGLDFTPITQQVNVHAPIASLAGGIGLVFENDAFGAERNMRIGLGYAYHLPLGNGLLSFGARANLSQRSLDGSQLRTPEGVYDGAFDHNDPILSNNNESGQTPAFDAGIYYRDEVWDFGLGVNNVTESTVDLTALSLTNFRTITFNAGMTYELTYAINLKPQVFIQSDLVQTQMAASLLVEYDEKYFGGASFRGFDGSSRDAVAIIGGLQISEKLRLGYSYDVILSPFKEVSTGSHEILLNYNLNQQYIFSKPPNTIYHPRAF